MAARKSKRLTLRRKAMIARKVRENFRKEKKKHTALENRHNRIPKFLLMSEEEKKEHERIAALNESINEEYISQPRVETPPHIRELEDLVGTCDLFIEVCDARDIIRSRNYDVEAFLNKHNIDFKIWLSYSDNIFLGNQSFEDFIDNGNESVDRRQFLGRLFNNPSLPSTIKKVCIFGMPKSGKFYLQKHLTNNSDHEITFELITTPAGGEITPSDVIRGVIDKNTVNMVFFLKQICEFFDVEKICEFYRIPYVSNFQQFLLELGNRLLAQGTNNKKIQKAANLIVEDLKTNKIAWYVQNNRFFIFLNNK